MVQGLRTRLGAENWLTVIVILDGLIEDLEIQLTLKLLEVMDDRQRLIQSAVCILDLTDDVHEASLFAWSELVEVVGSFRVLVE